MGRQTYKILGPLQNSQGHGNSCLTLNYNSTLLPPRSLLASPSTHQVHYCHFRTFFSFVEITIIFIYFLTWKVTRFTTWHRVFLHGTGWPSSCNPPASISGALGLQVCTATFSPLHSSIGVFGRHLLIRL